MVLRSISFCQLASVKEDRRSGAYYIGDNCFGAVYFYVIRFGVLFKQPAAKKAARCLEMKWKWRGQINRTAKRLRQYEGVKTLTLKWRGASAMTTSCRRVWWLMWSDRRELKIMAYSQPHYVFTLNSFLIMCTGSIQVGRRV